MQAETSSVLGCMCAKCMHTTPGCAQTPKKGAFQSIGKLVWPQQQTDDQLAPWCEVMNPECGTYFSDVKQSAIAIYTQHWATHHLGQCTQQLALAGVLMVLKSGRGRNKLVLEWIDEAIGRGAVAATLDLSGSSQGVGKGLQHEAGPAAALLEQRPLCHAYKATEATAPRLPYQPYHCTIPTEQPKSQHQTGNSKKKKTRAVAMTATAAAGPRYTRGRTCRTGNTKR
eukprot:1161141-Pelagomonas_calceolata.AAC.9